MNFEGLDDEYRGHVEIIYPGALGYLSTRTSDEIWDFFECLAHEIWEYENARETFSHPTSSPYVRHARPLDKSQFRRICYEHFHTPCGHVSCDYCDSFDHDVNTCPLLGRPHRLEALATLNRELYLHSSLQTNLSLGSFTSGVRSSEDFDVRSETLLHLGHDFHYNTHYGDLEEATHFL